MEVLPRKYRFRILSAGMSRFIQLGLADLSGNTVPFKVISNDGNLLVNPVPNTALAGGTLDEQGTAERFDIVVDFSTFSIGSKIRLVNRLRMRDDGRGPIDPLTLRQAASLVNGQPDDPVVGPIMEFRVVSQVESVDVPGVILRATDPDPSVVPAVLTQQIPVQPFVRTRLVGLAGRATATRATNRSMHPRARKPRCSRGPSGSPVRKRIDEANRIPS
jgi:FtsP/CotA-like multicopper oxidase with cupredoxin domain